VKYSDRERVRGIVCIDLLLIIINCDKKHRARGFGETIELLKLGGDTQQRQEKEER